MAFKSDISNKEKNELELKNEQEILANEDKLKFLYPSLDDPTFVENLSLRKEFYDTKYENPDDKLSIEEIADTLCNSEFELAPHQMFVRNFLSFQTPYNGLLLYHGLGSGKTCSAISVSEEMRSYMQQIGSSKRIIIVASPNVQENFKLQLFDERKLKLIDGLWNIKACAGNAYLKEINPMNMKGLSKEKVISQVKKIINNYYVFMGYVAFANYINNKSKVDSDMSDVDKKKFIKKKLNNIFNNRLIIIDEVHNIRMTDDNKNKRVATELLNLVKNVQNIRLLLLSATPMYNSYKEIIWLINLLNINDNRSEIEVKDVFNHDGNFKIDENGNEIGKELLIRKCRGYVSFVRGENPYTFPFRIWPDEFAPEHSIKKINYPMKQLNNKDIYRAVEMLSLYMTNIGDIQQIGYNYIIESIKNEASQNKNTSSLDFEDLDRFGYTLLQRPIEALNIIYPDNKLLEENISLNISDLVGIGGLSRIMRFDKKPIKSNFEYKTEEYNNIFNINEIGKYSGKIKNICDTILNSEGVILIYSQYIDGGIIPLALALEEMGFKRAGSAQSLFKTPPTKYIDANTYLPKEQNTNTFNPASYVMITGDPSISPNNIDEIKLATNVDNIKGEKVKVILISQAGSEGLDFKFIRQVHVLEPWYNMNRIEQIIGRAVRTCSHKDLPFEERNVEIFLYATKIEDIKEAADLYIYRLAEYKAVKIGVVSRTLKEASVDCLLNLNQTFYTQENMNLTVKQKLSNNQIIDYKVGDKPFSSICDYMDKCSFKCSNNITLNDKEVSLDTYNESFILMNNDKIIQRIKDIFKEKFFYNKFELIREINIVKNYPLIQINSALNQLIEDQNEFLVDMYGRLGRLINIDDLYLYQPLELNNSNISLYDRSIPIQYKHNSLLFEIPKLNEAIKEKVVSEKQSIDDTVENIVLLKLRENYTTASQPQEILASTDDWYKFASVIIAHLQWMGIERNTLNELLVAHMIESLKFEEILLLINYVSNQSSNDEIINLIKNYFNNQQQSNNNILFIQLQDDGTPEAIIKIGNKWEKAKEGDSDNLKPLQESTINKLINKQNLSNYVGFMAEFKKSYMVFKVKDINKPRNKGARCDQANKTRSLQFLNNIDADKYIENTNFRREELCVLQEFVMRLYNKNKKNNKIWFLPPVEAVYLNKIQNIK